MPEQIRLVLDFIEKNFGYIVLLVIGGSMSVGIAIGFVQSWKSAHFRGPVAYATLLISGGAFWYFLLTDRLALAGLVMLFGIIAAVVILGKSFMRKDVTKP